MGFFFLGVILSFLVTNKKLSSPFSALFWVSEWLNKNLGAQRPMSQTTYLICFSSHHVNCFSSFLIIIFLFNYFYIHLSNFPWLVCLVTHHFLFFSSLPIVFHFQCCLTCILDLFIFIGCYNFYFICLEILILWA